MDTTERSDEQLAADAAREGSDGPAFTALVHRYQQRIWRICYRLLGNAEDAGDAAQEVFVRLFLHRQRFAGRSSYSTWAHGVAVRTCLSMRRSMGRRRRRENEACRRDEQRSRSSGAESRDVVLDLPQMLETLDDEDRALLLLKYAEGCEYAELAEMFDLSVSACKMRVSRARDKLKQQFPEHDFGGDEN